MKSEAGFERQGSKSAVRFAIGMTCAGLVYFAVTTPAAGNTLVMMSGSVLMAAIIYAWAFFGISYLAGEKLRVRYGRPALSLLFSAPFIYVLLMQSIGQLNIRDVLALVPLALVLYFYVAYVASSGASGRKG